MTSTMVRRRSYTHEEKEQFAEKRAETRARVNRMADTAMAALATSETMWTTFLRAAAVHYDRPGVVNLLLLAVQAPDAEAVDSFQGWRARGRQVRKDEVGHKIYTTVIKRRPDSAGQQEEGTEEDGQAPDRRGTLKGFSVGTVFDFGQTDPIKGKEQPDLTPPHQISTQRAAVAVRAHLAKHGFRVEQRPGAGAVHMDAREDGPSGTWVLPVDPADAADPATTRKLIGILARCEILAASGGVDMAEQAESAAHLAALMLGLPAGPAPVPEVPPMSEDPNNPPIKKAAAAVVTLGRHIAAELSGRQTTAS